MTREALKLALEALENLFGIPDKWTGEGGGDVAVWRLGGSYRAQQAITAIKEALAQPEQEPVAIKTVSKIGKAVGYWRADLIPRHIRTDSHDITYLYTTPPQRTWVGLTDEEAMQICVDCGCLSEDWLTLLDAIEAKLKEKNT